MGVVPEIFACAGEGQRRPARYRRAFGNESRFPAGLFSAWHPMKPSGGIPVRISPGLTGGGGIDIWEKCVQVYQSAGVMTPFPFFLPARFFCGVHLIPVFARDSEQNRREQKRGDEIRYRHQGIHRVGDQPEGTEIDERQRADGGSPASRKSETV